MSITGIFNAPAKDLFFFGDSLSNSITVSRDAEGHLLGNGGAIHIFGGGATVDNTDLIQVFGNGGNDVITLDETNGALPAAQLSGGAGNDTLTGGSGNDTLSGGGGNDFLDGNHGADVAFLGAGNDIFRWDQGDGSDRVEGGSGSDELQFNGFAADEQFTLSASGDHALLTRVQGNIVMNLHEVEKVTVNASGGADTINVNDLKGTGVTDILVNLGVNGAGDGAADTININDDVARVVDNGNGNLTIFEVSGATVHITGFEAANDHLFIDGHLFGF
jgi:Ca2+-binding RTX toxin-like protein